MSEQEARLRRNESPFRLKEKPLKRDAAASRQRLLETDGKYQLSSRGVFDHRPDYFRVDVAERIIARFGLDAVPREG